MLSFSWNNFNEKLRVYTCPLPSKLEQQISYQWFWWQQLISKVHTWRGLMAEPEFPVKLEVKMPFLMAWKEAEWLVDTKGHRNNVNSISYSIFARMFAKEHPNDLQAFNTSIFALGTPPPAIPSYK